MRQCRSVDCISIIFKGFNGLTVVHYLGENAYSEASWPKVLYLKCCRTMRNVFTGKVPSMQFAFSEHCICHLIT